MPQKPTLYRATENGNALDSFGNEPEKMPGKGKRVSRKKNHTTRGVVSGTSLDNCRAADGNSGRKKKRQTRSNAKGAVNRSPGKKKNTVRAQLRKWQAHRSLHLEMSCEAHQNGPPSLPGEKEKYRRPGISKNVRLEAGGKEGSQRPGKVTAGFTMANDLVLRRKVSNLLSQNGWGES